MPHLVAAPDKFRDTASAAALGRGVSRAALRAGWSCDVVPIADGGEGLLDAIGGAPHRLSVTGPLGSPVSAEWRLVEAVDGKVGFIEMAQASGLVLTGGRDKNDPMRATTAGTGELIVAAIEAGCRTVVVGCGGSATTDGGAGAVAVLEESGGYGGTRVVAAVDVTTSFVDAAKVFGPQKGASEAQIVALTQSLAERAAEYSEHFGVDVSGVVGAGAAGGLAGGLFALGAEIVSGFDFVAEFVHLAERIQPADLVLTGEGRLDGTSFAGKVVGKVAMLVQGRVPVLCVVGAVAPGLETPLGIEVISLSERFGEQASRQETVELVEEVVGDYLLGYGGALG